MSFKFQYMSENGILEEGFFKIIEGNFPQSVILYMEGRVPYGNLPRGSRSSGDLVYEKFEDDYITKITDEIIQYDGINLQDSSGQRVVIAKILMAIRTEGEYKMVLQEQVKRLRATPNYIYETLNRDSVKYAVYKDIVRTLKHRKCVGDADGPLCRMGLTLHSETLLLDKIYTMTKDNIMLDMEDNVFRNISALGHYKPE